MAATQNVINDIPHVVRRRGGGGRRTGHLNDTTPAAGAVRFILAEKCSMIMQAVASVWILNVSSSVGAEIKDGTTSAEQYDAFSNSTGETPAGRWNVAFCLGHDFELAQCCSQQSKSDNDEFFHAFF
jgi:hypothetical protein